MYETSTAYDALNRATQLTLPQEASGSRPQLVPSYNRAGALAQVALDGQVLVECVAYNARGQRLLLARGNGLLTRYAYDDISFRLRRLRTKGYTPSGETLTPQAGTVRQDTAYAYDLAGNITVTRERTPQSGVGGTAELERLFEYDALYRLLSATGREHQPTAATPWQDETRSEGVGSTTGYTQRYQYDLLGNIQQLRHTAATSTDSFTRQFAYQSGHNYLQSVGIGNQRLDYRYDANGNVVQEQESRYLQWDAADQLRQFATWTGPTTAPTLLAYYVYDAGGQRTKKLTQTGPDTWQVTVYVDGAFEHRYEVSNGTQGPDQTTLYVLDGQSRLYQRRTGDALGDQRPAELYTLEDHLSSASSTVDASGGVISREEYYPFGETSFGSHARQRYRFCGKERDQESGLYYYGMRYYAPWLCRFVSVDPLAEDYPFFTPYQYAGNKPIISIDIDGMEGNNENNQTPIPARAENIKLHEVNASNTDMPVRKPISIHLNTANKLFPSGHLDNSVSKPANDATFVKQAINRTVLSTDFIQILQETTANPPTNEALSKRYGTVGVAGTSIFSDEFKNRPSAAYEDARMTGTYIGLAATGTGLFRVMGLGAISAKGFQNAIQQYVTKGFKLEKVDAADIAASMAGQKTGSVALDIGFGSLVDLTLEKGLKVAPFNKSLQEVRLDAASKLLQRNLFIVTPQTENPLIFLVGRAATTEATGRLKKASAQQKH